MPSLQAAATVACPVQPSRVRRTRKAQVMQHWVPTCCLAAETSYRPPSYVRAHARNTPVASDREELRCCRMA